MISRVQRDFKSSMEEIEVVWSTLQEFCEIQMHESCSTHVHIGADDGWSLEELKSISKGWLWFEQSIRAAMPSSRKDCDWAAPNPSHEYEARFKSARKMVILYEKALAEDSFSRVFSFVDRADSIDNLIERVAPERCLSWNYQNTRNKCQTIEFRRPPLSRDASDCKHWVVFALSFVQWALTADFTKEKYLENTYEFEATLRAMAEKLGISKHLKEFGDMEDLELASMSNFDALKTMKKKAERQDLGQRD